MKSFNFKMNLKNNLEKSRLIKQPIPLKSSTPQNTNIIIYVLAYNTNSYNLAKQHYSKYKWAKPILMKYQDYTFENAFWKQLLEISDEWEKCDMVGTISYKAYKKIDLKKMNNIIMNKLYYPKKFVSFMKSKNTLFNDISHSETDFKTLINYMSRSLNNSFDYNISYCNYWMTTPSLMKQFIEWHINKCLPILLKHPYSFNNSKYNGNLDDSTLLKLCGRPYYPNIPFILERINLLFFINNNNNNNTYI